MDRCLVIRPGAIGDFIVSIPALESLWDGYLEVWCAGPNVPLAGFADQACSIISTGLDRMGLPGVDPPPGLVARLRRFDRIVSWYGSNRPEFVEAFQELGLPANFLRAFPPDGTTIHATDYYNLQVSDLSKRRPGTVPVIRTGTPAPRGSIIIHPFSGGAAKCWPLLQFQETAVLLARQYTVEWTAGPEEPLEGATRFENLLDLARWLAGARIFIGNDSGISHLAAAVGTPVVALFGPTDPAVWAPRGPAVRILHPMNRLRPEDVASAVRSLC